MGISREESIRVTAVNFAIELAAEKPADRLTTVGTMLADAEEIEKYILGYETKSEQE